MLKQIKPTTPGSRHKIKLINNLININDKNLTTIKKKTGGRNFLGKITVRHIGGGHKQRIKIIDNTGNMGAYSSSQIINFVYDSNRTNFLALCKTQNNKSFLRLAADGQKIGDTIQGKYFLNKKQFNIGDITQLKNVSIGTKIFNIELKPNTGMKLAKAAGTFAIVIKHEQNKTYLKLMSKKIISVDSNCLCTIGVNNNIKHDNIIFGKAGVKRWKGIRPTVRGEAMNPIDHPHGGKTSGGVRLKTVYGKLAKFIKKH